MILRIQSVSLPSLCLCAFLIVGCGPSENIESTEPSETNRPNIVLVSIDTLRADHLSGYGYPRNTSPYLDELAAEATLFENAYVQAAHTLPSHMSIFTSLFPKAHGVRDGSGPLPDGIPTFPEILQKAGFRTYGLYANPWIDPKFGFARGFDSYLSRGGGLGGGAVSRDAALETIGQLAENKEQPFFLFLHLRDVHCGPILDNPDMPLYNSPPDYRDSFLPYPEIQVPHLPIDIWLSKVRLTPKEHANVLAQYDGGILYADKIVREVVNAMKDADLYSETLLIVTSDHGESLGEHGDFSQHGSVWEEGLRAPLIIKLPASYPNQEESRGARLKHRVQSVDIAPSILNLLSIPIPATFQGRDLFDPAERDVIAHLNRNSALIRGRYKLKIYRNPNETEVQLFDLVTDPEEAIELQADRPDLARSLSSELDTHLQNQQTFLNEFSRSPGAKVELDDEEREKLRSLGYVE